MRGWQLAFINKQKNLISIRAAADILGVSASTIYKRNCGTHRLTRIWIGRRELLLLGEVEAFRDEHIQRGIACRPESVVRQFVGQR